MKPKKIYKKFAYWLTPDEEAKLREELSAQGIKLRSAKGIVCGGLDEINKISSVAPHIWDETCARKGAWYRASGKNGLYLIISSFELPGWEEKQASVISRSDFKPPRLATTDEKEAMVEDKEIASLIPKEWLTVDEVEKRIYLRWARRLGSDVENYDFLYLTHTANHANFIKPRFFVKEDERIVPYSLDHSAHLCSCCLELFQVLGKDFKKKFVSPCSGASIFARLEPDRYLLVESP
ncbi:MAG: hypothetical protein JRI79_01175 [Deltaproteobacteria bacterium]|nr:hypothetical protein [Deltaproteobacteria bacterium]MBW2044949.1 hypothetical protein [Deltaproteobacteria bacterium]MBW2298749.1 hypothetical protein [Deltaproteobacteria bacterium]